MNERKMTKVKDQASDRPYEVIHILSDINRMQILRLLADRGELCARDILSFFPITQPTLSHHMNVLLENNLVEARKSGRWVFYHLSDSGIQDIIDFFEMLKKNSKNIQSQETAGSQVRKIKGQPVKRTAERTKSAPSPAAVLRTSPKIPSQPIVSAAVEKAPEIIPFVAPEKVSDSLDLKKSKKKDKDKSGKKDKKKNKKNKKNK